MPVEKALLRATDIQSVYAVPAVVVLMSGISEMTLLQTAKVAVQIGGCLAAMLMVSVASDITPEL